MMSHINLPLDINSRELVDQHIDNKGNIIRVISKNDHSTCHKCGNRATKRNGRAPLRTIQHLPIFEQPVYLKITPVRYSCDHCDDHTTTTEQYDWCKRNASSTHALNEYIMRQLINSTIEDVSKKTGVSPKRIQNILNNAVGSKVDWNKVKNIDTIGIDEISKKKGHPSYVTIISGQSKCGDVYVLATLSGRSKKDVSEFLHCIPKQIKKNIKSVCTDMYDGYVYAAIEVFGVQSVVIDRYHVSKLYRAPLDKLRITEMLRLKTLLRTEEYDRLDGMMWMLRKNHECLNKEEREKIKLLYKHSPLLKEAHYYAIKLTTIFNTHCSRKYGMAKFKRWITAVGKSTLSCFDTFIKTLKKYLPYIANYFKGRKNSGFVEGLNNKMKVAARRCYGFIKDTTIFQRLSLDLQGYAWYGL